MAPKRPINDDAEISRSKKHRTGFKVGPDNLPDGTWRRKVIKIKKDLIHKSKIKKSYAKIKAREQLDETPTYTHTLSPPSPDATMGHASEPTQELHPERQAMLDAPRNPTPPPLPDQSQLFLKRMSQTRKGKRPAYFEKEQAFAEQQKQEAEARRKEFERREKEKRERIEERERFRKAMAKARSGGKNGQRKLGRESKVLLERVKKVVGE